LTDSDLSIIFAKHDQYPVHLMGPFLLGIIRIARGDWSEPNSLRQQIQNRLPVFQADNCPDLNLDNLRTGPWDSSIDGSALRRAMSMMAQCCGVYLNQVKQLLLIGNQTIGPAQIHHPQLGNLRMASPLEDPKLLFIHAMFGKLSKRSDHQALIADPHGAHYTALSQLVAANVEAIVLSVDVNNPWEVCGPFIPSRLCKQADEAGRT
jgi:hypothetical protein